MAVDVTGASACYRDNRETLLASIICGGKTDAMFRKMTGVKSHEFIHVLDTEITLSDCNCNCDNDNTAHKFVDREISVSCIQVNDKICKDAFDGMYKEAEIRANAGSDIGSAGDILAESFAMQIAKANENLKWKGDTTSSDENLNKANGIVKIMTDDTDVVKGTIAEALFTSDPNQALATLEALIPESALCRGENTREGALPFIAVPQEIFRTLRRALALETATSCCKFTSEKWNGLDSFLLHDTDIRVISVAALNGTDRIVIGSMHDLYMATDGENDYEDIQGWWDPKCRSWYQLATFKVGFQIAFPEDMVLVTITT